MPYPHPQKANCAITWTGRLLDIARPSYDDVVAADIAHGLSRQFRYGGSIADYTVAQHSVAVAKCVHDNWPGERRHGLQDALKLALMHDAAEAYIRDVPTPAKRLMPDYRQVENDLEDAIFPALGITRTWHDMVAEADSSLCGAEARHFLAGRRDDLDDLFPKPTLTVDPSSFSIIWGLDESRDAFMHLWVDLVRGTDPADRLKDAFKQR